nr:hypothetical protein [uncultured Prevotella sp.]
MERKIGETFEFKGKTYEVIESLLNICDNCAFSGECDATTETVVGRCSCTSRLDGKNVIFKEIKDNQLTINIPKGMEIDIENCDLKNGIIKFKKKELRYEDIENSLDLEGNRTGIPVDDNNAFKLCATDRLMNIVRYYNGDWKPDWSNNKEGKFYISYNFIHKAYFVIEDNSNNVGTIVFKHKEDAQAVIDNPNFREILDVIYKN